MRNLSSAALALLVAFCLTAGAAHAASVYEVTITNLTRGQIMSAPVVASHNADFELFVPGEPASDELADLAEDALTDPLVALLHSMPEVHDVNVGGGNILPGDSMSIEIGANGSARYISLASMLVTTNDAFVAVRGLEILRNDPTTMTALAYDAGSEANLESCDHIPGPPCDNPEVPTDEPGEGFVHVHAGVHGIADLASEDLDWRNPVARISVTRIR